MALRVNPECYQAFEKLIRNNLIVDSEKVELIDQIQFSEKALWMRDFYFSKINKEVLTQDKAEGFVRMPISEEESLRIQLQGSGDADAYGVSPIRLQNNVFETEGESLRAPNLRQAVSTQRKGPRPFASPNLQEELPKANEQTLSVIEVLSSQESLDVSFIQAEQFFNQQNF